MASDPFDDVFTLEDRFYRQGYQQGLDDGAAAGRVEGRQFGMSTGFDKFLAAGRLAGRALVWANRLPSDTAAAAACALLPPLPDGNHPRLARNVGMVYALVEPETLSTANADDAVHDFDDRFRRAQGKAKVVEKMIS